MSQKTIQHLQIKVQDDKNGKYNYTRIYNVENYIEECLNSILSQTYKDIKIIVVNDGFKENINEII